jgi:hypothetical protein
MRKFKFLSCSIWKFIVYKHWNSPLGTSNVLHNWGSTPGRGRFFISLTHSEEHMKEWERILRDKLINERIRWYGHNLWTNEDRIARKILNMKVKENIQEEHHDEDGNKRSEKVSGRRKVLVISRHTQKWAHQNKMIIISIITVQPIIHHILCVLFTSVFLSSHCRAC